MPPTNLYQYYTGQGQNLPSLTDRAKIYEQVGLGSAAGYSGTAAQNTALLTKLQSTGGTPPTGTSTTPAIPPAPGTPATPVAPTPPQTQGGQGGSSLLNFANTLDQAVGLAREKRNTLSVGMMAPFKGTLAASDFSSILNNMNTASDNRASDLTKQALDLSKPGSPSEIYTTTNDNGDVTGIDKNSGKVLWTQKGVGNKQTPGASGGAKPYHDGTLVYTAQDYTDDSQALEQSRGDDGWVDPTVYQTLYKQWVKNGGTTQGFLAKFPPKHYVNPENDWLPEYLKNPTKPKTDVGNPFQ